MNWWVYLFIYFSCIVININICIFVLYGCFDSLTFITLTEDNVHNKVQRFSTELYMYMYHGPEAGGVNAHV